MHHHAPNPAAQPHLSLNAFSVPFLSREERNGGGERPSFPGTLASRDEQRFGRTSAAEKREGDFGPVGFIRLVSRPLARGHASGPIRRPAARRSSASTSPPLQGHGSSRNKFVYARQMRRTNFFRAPPRMQSLALGSRAHSLASPV